ncbi:MAG TPA: pitrilysin family protein [Thermoanaerobaculia bacterium]|nr:pitrilysin family protein [Thermoanaerobaculia bacterium]
MSPPPGGPAPRRDRPPAPAPLRPFAFPPFLRRPLGNGLTVMATVSERAPLIELALVFPAGADRDPAGANGTATLTATLLDEGTRSRDALAIAAAVADLGGRLATGADWDVGYLEVQVLAEHAGEALALLAELATVPTFPAEELERTRRRRLAELLRRRSDPSALAAEHFAGSVYGDHPYGRSTLGDEASIGRFDRTEAEAFFRAAYAPAGALLVAAGALDPEELYREAERVLGALPGGTPLPRPDLAAPPLTGTRVVIVDRPRGAQTELRVGHTGVTRRHPDYLPLAVMNTLLGGKFTSRINLNLRERHGYTYGATSRFTARCGPGPFVVQAAVATEVAGAATREILGELARICDEPVAGEELEDAQSYLVGTFPYTLQSASGLRDRLETLAVYDLPDDYYQCFPESVLAVDRETVLRVAREHLHPRDLVVVAVGPAGELEPQLAELGAVEVITPAPAPSPAETAATLVPGSTPD